jgi:cell division protein FtsQ
MSTLTRDPMQPAGKGAASAPAGGTWPVDPGQRLRPGAPIGAEWDPLCEPWPALIPPAPVVRAEVPPGHQPAMSPRGAIGAGRHPAPPPDPSQRPLQGSRGGQLVPKLVLPPEPRPARDVSPSRLAYRMNRLWLTPAVRRFVCQGLPALLLLAALAGFWAGDSRRAMVIGFFADLRTAIEDRPEFRIDAIEVLTDTPEVAQAVLVRLDLGLPASSLRVDLPELRARIEALDAVARAALQVRAGGLLEVRVTERSPAMVWRHAGGLALVDAEGRQVALITERAVRPDLPLIAGDGAPAAIAEAHRLLAAAAPVRDRVVGLTRVGERRWDLVLDRDQRILLPARGAVTALERVLALDGAQDLLARDLVAVDMRNPLRPTLRLSPEASTELARIRRTDTRMANR